MGGGIRVGLEDNIFYDRKKSKLATNEDLVKRVHVIAHANERPLMTSKECRKLLNLNEGYGKYGLKVDINETKEV